MYFTQKRLKLYLTALLVVEIFICFGYRSAIHTGNVDYRLYYSAGYMVRTGQSHLLYDYAAEQRIQSAVVTPLPVPLPFFAPPFAALVFAPFSLLPFVPSLLVFGLFNVALLALAIVFMRPYLAALAMRWRPLPALLFLTFLPAALTLVMGQLSIILLVLYCACFALLKRGRELAAGFVLALALLKFQFAIPVALLFLLWRRWRVVAGFLTGAALLCALSAWIIGPRALLPYLASITHMSELTGTALQRTVAISPRAIANLHGLILSFTPNNRIATVLTLVASIALLAWAATRRPSLPLALLVAMLVSYHLYPCDLSLLLLPISLLCDRLFSAEPAAFQPQPRDARFPWLEKHRRQILLCALGSFLISPVFAELTSFDALFLFAVPILALALCPYDWATLSLPPERTTQAVTEPRITAS